MFRFIYEIIPSNKKLHTPTLQGHYIIHTSVYVQEMYV
jgi:hypothetical protein